MPVLAAVAVFLIAAFGVFAATYAGLRLAGRAMNGRRPPAERRRLGLAAAAVLALAPFAAAAGFAAIGAVLYGAQSPSRP